MNKYIDYFFGGKECFLICCIGAILIILAPARLHAQTPTCMASSFPDKPIGENRYRINNESIQALGSGFSLMEWKYTVL